MEATDRPFHNPQVSERRGLGRHSLLFEPIFAETVGLDAVGAEVWRLIDGRRSLVEITAAIQARFPGGGEIVAGDVRRFVADLARRGFIITANNPFMQPADPLAPAPAGTRGSRKLEPCGPVYSLSLAGGVRLAIGAGDAEAARVVARFAVAARLNPADTAAQRRRLWVTTGGVQKGSAGGSRAAKGPAICRIDPLQPDPGWANGRGRGSTRHVNENEWLWRQLVRLSSFIGREAQSRGGVLLHGALAALPGRAGRETGVLMAGRSGVGKSTASSRLPPPWRVLCDDTALVARRTDGTYWAHPWPTWSRFFAGATCDNWEVQKAVPLKAVFILEQAQQERLEPADAGEAICMLAETARQAARHLWRGAGPAEMADFHRQRFDSLCRLVRAVPVHLLDVSLKGRFWREMERVIT